MRSCRVVVQQLRPVFNPSISPQFQGISFRSSYFGGHISYSHNPPSSSLRIRAAPLSSTNHQSQDASPTDPLEIKDDQVDGFQLIQSHQEKAARLPPIEEIKTILSHTSRGVLSTVSLKYNGYPSGSMVDFACDAFGSPLLAVSSLAVHTKDLLANPKCSLLVAKDPEDRSDLVIVVHGDATPVSKDDKEAVRTAYLSKHPNAFWVNFGDFQFLRIEPQVVRYVSGVATALLGSGEFTKDEFRTAKVDPIYQFSKPITSHMNKDHSDDTKLIVQYSTSIPVDYAYMLDMDSLGFNVKAGYQGNTFKLRIPFTRRAGDRKDVKTLIVEMLQTARAQASE
ncbi:FMN binding [Striga hermonthica]|uniref:FMN binding n=1 Tax=Striga hermonthica TaxID=68872 RepID=A0A9N7RGG0_STRHE|nr:FMN binding [Striga hermonthica]